MRKNADQEAESSAAKKPRADEADAVPLSSETAALSVDANDDAIKCAYCQSSTNRHGDTEDLLVCKDCQANSQYSLHVIWLFIDVVIIFFGLYVQLHCISSRHTC